MTEVNYQENSLDKVNELLLENKRNKIQRLQEENEILRQKKVSDMKIASWILSGAGIISSISTYFIGYGNGYNICVENNRPVRVEMRDYNGDGTPEIVPYSEKEELPAMYEDPKSPGNYFPREHFLKIYDAEHLEASQKAREAYIQSFEPLEKRVKSSE